MKQNNETSIQFKTKLLKINDWTILRLPQVESLKLPSRALTMVKGIINGYSFKAALEPDGKGSHWFKIDNGMLKAANIKLHETITLKILPTKEWIEPDVPNDLHIALDNSSKAKALWKDITPNARWDWIRWIRAVKTQETRKKHIKVALSKLNKGMRRPCCFNRNLCSEPAVSRNWVLLEQIN